MSLPRVKVLGWALFEVLTSAQVTSLDATMSLATDGRYASEAAGPLTLAVLNTLSASIQMIAHDSFDDRWHFLSTTAGDCRLARGTPSSDLTAGFTLTGFGAASFERAAAEDGTGVVLAALNPNASSQNKVARRTAGSVTFTATPLATAANTELCTALGHHPGGGGVFVAGMSAGTLETSATGASGTWTARTTPITPKWNGVASNGSRIVVVGESTDKCITSDDHGATWSQRTIGVSKSWNNVHYSAIEGQFLTIATDGTIYKSADGITWSAVTPTNAPQPTGNPSEFLGVWHKTWLCRDIPNVQVRYSQDLGATWRTVLNHNAQATANARLARNGQWVLWQATSNKVWGSGRGI